MCPMQNSLQEICEKEEGKGQNTVLRKLLLACIDDYLTKGIQETGNTKCLWGEWRGLGGGKIYFHYMSS